MKKPPLGIKPKWLVNEHRCEELYEKIQQYKTLNLDVPLAWIIEHKQLTRIIKKREKRISYSCRLFSFSYRDGYGWLRTPKHGSGLSWKDTERHSLSFSERNGFTKYYKVSKWVIAPVAKSFHKEIMKSITEEK